MPNTHITEIKHRLFGETSRFSCRHLESDPKKAVIVYVSDRDWSLLDGKIVFPKGAVNLGYYWADRHYNVYHRLDEVGRSRGLYLNICDRPQISAEQIEWVDWIVDVIYTPETGAIVLDRDEIPADIASDLLAKIDATEHEIITNIAEIVAEVEQASAAFVAQSPLVRNLL